MNKQTKESLDKIQRIGQAIKKHTADIDYAERNLFPHHVINALDRLIAALVTQLAVECNKCKEELEKPILKQ